MEATYTELLAPTKTSASRACTWTPVSAGVGVLTVTDKRSHTRYAVCEFATDLPGRAFKLTKEDRAVYCVRFNNLRDHSCDCPGHTYKGHCKHVDAVAALLANDWVDDVERISDRAAEVEAMDRHYSR